MCLISQTTSLSSNLFHHPFSSQLAWIKNYILYFLHQPLTRVKARRDSKVIYILGYHAAFDLNRLEVFKRFPLNETKCLQSGLNRVVSSPETSTIPYFIGWDLKEHRAYVKREHLVLEILPWLLFLCSFCFIFMVGKNSYWWWSSNMKLNRDTFFERIVRNFLDKVDFSGLQAKAKLKIKI